MYNCHNYGTIVLFLFNHFWFNVLFYLLLTWLFTLSWVILSFFFPPSASHLPPIACTEPLFAPGWWQRGRHCQGGGPWLPGKSVFWSVNASLQNRCPWDVLFAFASDPRHISQGGLDPLWSYACYYPLHGSMPCLCFSPKCHLCGWFLKALPPLFEQK